MKIVFTGGGTAGHIMPNVAIINSLSPTDEVFYFGCNGMEKTLVPQHTQKVKFVEIFAPKLKRKFALSNLLIPFRLLKSVARCKKQLKAISPDLIFCKGGYVSLPVALAGKSLSIPVVLHESDVTTGLANRLCAKNCALFLSAFENTAIKNARTVGTPIRGEIYSAKANEGLQTMGFDGKKPILIFLGGSQGANQLNALAQGVYPYLKDLFDIFVVSGRGKSFEQKEGLKSVEFCHNLFDCLKASSLCVTRGGANTLCELCAINLPFITLPLTASSRGEQTANALYFSQRGCGVTLQGEVTVERLIKAVKDLQKKSQLYQHKQRKLNIDGTQLIVDLLYGIANNQKGKAPKEKK